MLTEMKMKYCLVLLAFLVPSATVFAKSDVKISQVKDNIHYIVSPKGGNVVVSVGSDGVFIIDDQLRTRSEVIGNVIKSVTDKPVQFVLNTHYHFDHTGGNEHFGSKGAIIVAHKNVQKRLSTKQFITFFKKELPALTKAGLPVITFEDDITFHYNDDNIEVIHLSAAHTDGDAAAFFKHQNVIVTGDTVFNSRYPFIDVEHGGSITGMIKAVDMILDLANAETIIVPGHGVLMNKQDLLAYRQVLSAVSLKVEALIKQGKTLQEVLAERPSKAFDKTYGNDLINPEAFVTFVYNSLQS